MMDQNGVVIVGAGHGGTAAAFHLREYGYAGPVTLVGRESVMPYQRPPLSKAFLKGLAEVSQFRLRDEAAFSRADIELRLGTEVVNIDRGSASVELSDGRRLSYDHLVLATGSVGNPLPFEKEMTQPLQRLLTFQDAEHLRTRLRPGLRLLIVGAGFIGLEVAASARDMGIDVVVVEREDRVLARVLSETLARVLRAEHEARGVTFRTGCFVDRLGRGASIAMLRDGSELSFDMALAAAGALACDHLARTAGLDCSASGVIVDDDTRTSDAAIFAIGDIAEHNHPFGSGRATRIESVANAVEQARRAAAAIAAKSRPAFEVPWFWSDQYDHKLQIAGIRRAGQTEVIRHLSDRSLAVFHLEDDRVRCVESLNAPREFMAGKLLVGAATPVDAAHLADPETPLKSLIGTRTQ